MFVPNRGHIHIIPLMSFLENSTWRSDPFLSCRCFLFDRGRRTSPFFIHQPAEIWKTLSFSVIHCSFLLQKKITVLQDSYFLGHPSFSNFFKPVLGVNMCIYVLIVGSCPSHPAYLWVKCQGTSDISACLFRGAADNARRNAAFLECSRGSFFFCCGPVFYGPWKIQVPKMERNEIPSGNLT